MRVLKLQNHIIKVLENRNIFYITPTNLIAEKTRFFKALNNNQEYNPQFKYRKILFDIKKLRSEINELINYKGIYHNEINNIAKRYLLFLNLIINRGNNKFTEYSKKLYGFPNQNEINYAKNIIKNNEVPKNKNKTYSAEYVKNKFQKLISKYGWKIILKNIPSKMKVSPKSKTLVINKSSFFTKKEIMRLEYHKIKTHVIRQVNNQKLPAIIRNCFNYIETEEGLALQMEEMHNCLSKEQLRIYAARTIAVHLSLTKSFYEVFTIIRKYGFDNETAFQITSRAKRGLQDTKKPRGFTKDHIYLSGKLKIEEYLKAGGQINDLFIGKISINDVSKVKKILETLRTQESLQDK